MPMGESLGLQLAEVPLNSTDLIVVRHGETTWNHDHRLQGQCESDLNAMGRAQAMAVARRLASGDLPFVAVYSSDLRRAADTAQAIADLSGHREVRKVEGLRERHLGLLQGHTMQEGKQKQPASYAAFMSKDPLVEIPGGGEGIKTLNDRVTAAMEEIARKHSGERVVVVCHGGVMTSLHRHATGFNPKKHVVNASINIIRISDGDNWQVLKWGDIQHLSGVGFDKDAFGGGDDSA